MLDRIGISCKVDLAKVSQSFISNHNNLTKRFESNSKRIIIVHYCKLG